jgi:hypothetical protein
VVASHALPVAIIGYNPGIFADEGTDPRPAIAFHGSDRATGVVSVDGSTKANDVVTVIIRDREYSYTVTQADQDAGDPEKGGTLFQGLERVMVALIERINNDAEVEAFRSGQFTRIRLQARVAGPAGNGIPYRVRTSTDSSVILTGTTDALCCANQAGARVTVENPAIPGETIIVFAAGLGLVEPDDARAEQKTGETYKGPEINRAEEFVSSLTGGRTANVLYAGLQVGAIGLYRVDLQLNQGLPTNPQTQLTIAQGFQVSNIVTFPVFNPIPTTQ